MNQTERRKALIRMLLSEQPGRCRGLSVPTGEAMQRRLLRALLNLREPMPAAPELLQMQDAYLQAELSQKTITDADALEELQPGICLWRGDITTLRCDAIVNAANSALLGCFCPNHGCIDNAIHTYAGIQLRLACKVLMDAQGHEEPTGTAKLTPAYNLPCRYVLHTVGPIVYGQVTQEDGHLLASCYRACLDLAAEHALRSVAFCCISTGEFHFPHSLAAQIAMSTVSCHEAVRQGRIRVIFNVFKEQDDILYKRLLGAAD
ncbi:MAG: protein-ADP-ribose hydrolase [Candidatus Ventricola sp.]